MCTRGSCSQPQVKGILLISCQIRLQSPYRHRQQIEPFSLQVGGNELIYSTSKNRYRTVPPSGTCPSQNSLIIYFQGRALHHVRCSGRKVQSRQTGMPGEHSSRQCGRQHWKQLGDTELKPCCPCFRRMRSPLACH